jgi:hypothetical protein
MDKLGRLRAKDWINCASSASEGLEKITSARDGRQFDREPFESLLH